jgi:hypothetical protein
MTTSEISTLEIFRAISTLENSAKIFAAINNGCKNVDLQGGNEKFAERYRQAKKNFFNYTGESKMNIQDTLNIIEWDNYGFSINKKHIEAIIEKNGVKREFFVKGVKYLIVTRFMGNNGYGYSFPSFYDVVFLEDGQEYDWCINRSTIGIEISKIADYFTKIELGIVNDIIETRKRQIGEGEQEIDWYGIKNQRFFELYDNAKCIVLFEDHGQSHVGHDLFGLYDEENEVVNRIPIEIFWEHYLSLSSSESYCPNREEVRSFFETLIIPKRISVRNMGR